MSDFQKPFQTPQASPEDQESPEELRNIEIAFLVILGLFAMVGLWMFLNPAPTVQESDGYGFVVEDDGHVLEFSNNPNSMSPEQAIASAHERNRVENLHSTPPPESDFVPTFSDNYSPEMREGIEHLEATGASELFKDGNIPDMREVDMSQYMPAQVREAGSVPMREATRAAEARIQETPTYQ